MEAKSNGTELEEETGDDKKLVVDTWQLAVLEAICRTVQEEENVRGAVLQQIVSN